MSICCSSWLFPVSTVLKKIILTFNANWCHHIFSFSSHHLPYPFTFSWSVPLQFLAVIPNLIYSPFWLVTSPPTLQTHYPTDYFITYLTLKTEANGHFPHLQPASAPILYFNPFSLKKAAQNLIFHLSSWFLSHPAPQRAYSITFSFCLWYLTPLPLYWLTHSPQPINVLKTFPSLKNTFLLSWNLLSCSLFPVTLFPYLITQRSQKWLATFNASISSFPIYLPTIILGISSVPLHWKVFC